MTKLSLLETSQNVVVRLIKSIETLTSIFSRAASTNQINYIIINHQFSYMINNYDSPAPRIGRSFKKCSDTVTYTISDGSPPAGRAQLLDLPNPPSLLPSSTSPSLFASAAPPLASGGSRCKDSR